MVLLSSVRLSTVYTASEDTQKSQKIYTPIKQLTYLTCNKYVQNIKNLYLLCTNRSLLVIALQLNRLFRPVSFN